MLLSLITLLLILGIVFYQGLQGLFSSLIMAVCTLVCVVLAFNYYEPLAALLYKYKPLHADAIALVCLVVLPLLALRLAVDRLLPGNVVLSVWADRIGGGLFGIVTALLIVGTLLIALQMLPFGRSFLGVDFYNDNLERVAGPGIDAPGFTLGLVKGLSAGSASGRKPFGKVHDNLVLELWGTRNCREYGVKSADDSRRTRRTESSAAAYDRNPCTPNALQVLALYDVSDENSPDGGKFSTVKLSGEEQGPSEPSQMLVLRAVIKGARDGDGWYRLMGTHFRLVAADGQSYYPVGYLGYDTGKWRVYSDKTAKVEIDRDSKKSDTLQVDLLYRVPRASGLGEGPQMEFVAFRRIAKAAVPAKATKGMPGLEGALAKNLVYGEVSVDHPADSALGGFLFLPDKAKVTPDNPVNVGMPQDQANRPKIQYNKDGANLDVKLTNSLWSDGQAEGKEGALANINKQGGATRLYEPKGRKVIRLTGEAPASGATNLPLLGEVTFQPTVQTSVGKFPPAGGWVKWKEGDEVHVFVSYTTEEGPLGPDDISGRFNEGLTRFKEAYTSNRANVTEAGLLFLVPDTAIVNSFRFAGAAPEAFCAGPLSVAPAAK
jgi:hypothetical protein